LTSLANLLRIRIATTGDNAHAGVEKLMIRRAVANHELGIRSLATIGMMHHGRPWQDAPERTFCPLAMHQSRA
jgi:hypothetical protein